MCKIKPILNGKLNLCRVSKFLNRTKNKKCKSVAVLAYMKKMKGNIETCIGAIVKALPESQKRKDFVSNLVQLLNDAYKLDLWTT